MMERLYNGVFRVDRPCMANVRRIDQGALPMVLEMNRRGILVDVDHFRRLGTTLQAKIEAVEADITALVGHPVNPTSGDQVARLLFDEMKLEVPGGGRMTRSQRRVSTDDETLCSMLGLHPVVRLITDGRELVKLKGTYCDALPTHVGVDGRIRTTLKMYTARTGRLASEEPNLQNVSTRSEEGRQVRAGFIASPGCILASIDLSQIELAWAAELSQDPTMLSVFDRGQDLHVRTACALFQLDYERVASLWNAYKRGVLGGAEQEEMRDFELSKRLPSKTLSFATLYGVTPAGLRLQILAAGGPSLSEDICVSHISQWFKLFGGVSEWMQLQYSRVRRFGLNWTAFGRPRLIPEICSALPGQRNKGLRQAGNSPIQGSAGDHLKLIMAEIQDGPVQYFRSLGKICDPLLQVHDELLFELDVDIIQDFVAWAHYIFCRAVRPMRCPVKAVANTGHDWSRLK